MFALVAGQFAQVEFRRRTRLYLLGLLSRAKRKNSWVIAEQAGDASPDGMQLPLNFYAWDADAVRDALRDYVLDRLGDPSGVMVADETGFLEKDTKPQQAVLVFDASRRLYALIKIDSRHYSAWTYSSRVIARHAKRK